MNTQTQMFPHAPAGWTPGVAEAIAAEENMTLTEDHWVLIHCLQEYYHRNDFPRLRIVTDALDERFHAKGGMKYLRQLLPQGPITFGCKLAGLETPAGCVDLSFGTAA